MQVHSLKAGRTADTPLRLETGPQLARRIDVTGMRRGSGLGAIELAEAIRQGVRPALLNAATAEA